jgi:hypothetical protein
MRNRNEVSEIRERFTDGREVEPDTSLPREWSGALGAFAALFIAAVIAGVLLSGCGGQHESSVQADASGQGAVSGQGTQAQLASTAAMPAPAQGGLSAGDRAVLEGLPPDLSVSVGDTLVTPGQAVEFVVEGTDDVAQVALSDGRDEPMPFVRDTTGGVWRAQYRVPLHPKGERFGISVTARTNADRWRRVWVFLHTRSAQADPAGREDIDNPDSLANGR